jgi:hypothetical protein
VRSSEIEPANQVQTLRGVRLRVQRAPKGPQVQRADERRAGAGVHQADLHEIVRNDDDGLHPYVLDRHIHHRPEVYADVEVKDRRPSQSVVVSVDEEGADEILEPRHEGPERVAVAHAVGEASQVVDVAHIRINVLGRDVVTGAGVDEGSVRDVRQLGGLVHKARRGRKAAVYADETCNSTQPAPSSSVSSSSR